MGDRFPFGIPQGWYAIATSQELAVGDVASRRYFDRELAIYRTPDGVSVIDAFCPHMGAHLGKLGRVEGHNLRCGFHGFRYDQRGTCVATEYDSPPPPDARLRKWEVCEHSGFIFTWFDPEGRPPAWEMRLPDQSGVSEPRVKLYELDTHPQETTENSVDFGHFTKLHGFEDGVITKALQTEGAYLDSTYLAQRCYYILGKRVAIPVEYDVRVSGLGYSQVEVEVGLWGFPLRMRIFVLPTPIDDEHIHLRLAASTKDGWRWPMMPLVRAITHNIVCDEVNQDLDVWQHKSFVHPPQLAKGDGPILAYRRWAEQFYTELGEA